MDKVKKRDGRIVDYDRTKIENAIYKALFATGLDNREIAKRLALRVEENLKSRFKEKIPSVEEIQDVVEKVLIGEGFSDTAKAYILYRRTREELRETKYLLGVKDDLKLSINAVTVLRKRYLIRDDQGEIVETPKDMFRRVARAIAEADKFYQEDWETSFRDFYEMMVNLEFLPNSPTLMNAATPIGQLSACFVLPIPDSIPGIFDTLKYTALIHQSGGGTGFSFSKIRPEGDIVKSTKGIASGPVSFMRIYDMATEVVKQGGRRRGANMGILNVNHPDIIEFITAKGKKGILNNFNLSVAVTDEFMEKVERGEDYELINPRNGKPVRKVNAKDIFDLICHNAWAYGDPGLIFLDEINRKNPTPEIGTIESTNPCGEQPLLPYESCNLGSINLVKMIKKSDFDWEKFRATIWKAVHFLDNVIDVNKFPLPEIEEMTKANRKIGLGVMGFADALLRLNIPYDSEEALVFGERVAQFLTENARAASRDLARRRGPFPNFPKSIYKNGEPIRNATVTTIAPTGTISIIAGVSSGIEPIFALSYVRIAMGGHRLFETNEYFEETLKKRGLYSSALIREVAEKGSVRNLSGIPDDIKRLFATALDISYDWHIRIQATFQKYIDNGVSKTVNLPFEASPETVRQAYFLAWRLKCKGITVYRYGSKEEQVLYIKPPTKDFLTVGEEFSGGCPEGVCIT
uniref:Vitamin B12-dependent ribonucleotide reductase n=1 Tax=candidate division WOR-3 bacterium TaxID=2052148 RepID=A0A7C3Z1N1_UNCW3